MSYVLRGAMAALALAVVVACGGKPEQKAASDDGTAAVATSQKQSPEKSADSVGVPECDEYIQKYEACLDGKVPEAARAALRQSFDQTRATWKQAAETPGGKEALTAGCTQALDAAQQAMAPYGCTW